MGRFGILATDVEGETNRRQETDVGGETNRRGEWYGSVQKILR